MTKPKREIPTVDRCPACGKATLKYVGDPLAERGLWQCQNVDGACKYAVMGRPPVRPPNPDTPKLPGRPPIRAPRSPDPKPDLPSMATVNAMNPPMVNGIRPIPISTIIDVVCQAVQVDATELLCKLRHARLIMARRLIVRLGRDLTHLSFPDLAAKIQPASIYAPAPNHSSAISAVKRYEAMKDYPVRKLLAADDTIGPAFGDETMADLCDRLREKLRGAA